jgi:hypothetical protein
VLVKHGGGGVVDVDEAVADQVSDSFNIIVRRNRTPQLIISHSHALLMGNVGNSHCADGNPFVAVHTAGEVNPLERPEPKVRLLLASTEQVPLHEHLQACQGRKYSAASGGGVWCVG